MLESALKEQLKGIFAGLEANFAFDISVSSSHENRAELLELLGDVADCSDHITYSVNEGNHKVTGEHRIFGYVFIDAANCELQLLVGRKGFPNRVCATECFTGKMF